LTSAITRGAQSGYHQHVDTSDYGELLLEQCDQSFHMYRWACHFNFFLKYRQCSQFSAVQHIL